MANKKISELQSRTPSLSDLLLVGDPSSGYSYKCTVTALATIIETDIADGYVTIGTTQTISGAKTFSNNLTLTSVSNANTDTDKFLVLNASNIVNFRTGAEVLSDIGGQGALTLTTTGSSGASTLVGNTLNIPTYTLSGLGGISGSGSTGYLPKFTGTTSIGNSIVQDNGSTLNIAGGIICNAISASSLTSDQYIAFQNINTSYSLSGYTLLYATLTNPGFIFNYGDGTRIAIFRYAAGSYTYTLPSATGTLALTSDITSSISGTPNYIPKFTGSNSIGNSVIYESSSNIGIGTISPNYPLHINSTSNARIGVQGTTNFSAFQNINSSGSLYWGIDDNAGANFTGTAYGRFIYSSGAYPLIFFTNSTERMRLDASGNLGIGTTSPTGQLSIKNQIANGNNPVASYAATNGVDGQNFFNGYYAVNSDGLGTYPRYFDIVSVGSPDGSNGGSNIRFFTNPIANNSPAVPRMVINSAGNVGIGTTSPSGIGVVLNLYGSTNINSNLILEGNSGNSFLSIISSATNGVPPSFMSKDGFRFAYASDKSATGYSEQMRLTASGNLGIGTTSPTSISNYIALTINGTSGSFTEYQENGGRAFRIGSDGATGGFISQTSADPIRIFTSSTERMRITSGGNVGIGTTSPSYKLQVEGAFGTNPGAYVSGTTYGTIGANRGASSASAGLNLYSVGSQKWFAGIYENSDNFGYYSVGTNSFPMVINYSTGNIGIGTTAPQLNLHIFTSGTSFTSSTVTYSSATSRGILLDNSAGTNQSGNAIWFANSGLYSAIASTRESTGDWGTDIRFYTHPTTITNQYDVTERMRITSSGNVGIGTATAPGTNGIGLALYASDYPRLTFRNSTTGDGTGDGVQFVLANADFEMYNRESGALLFGTSNAERMRITSGGDVGIGVTSPGAKLEVNGAIKTSNPSGGTAKPWKLGEAVSTAVTLSGYAVVEIDGVAYKLALVTAN